MQGSFSLARRDGAGLGQRWGPSILPFPKTPETFLLTLFEHRPSGRAQGSFFSCTPVPGMEQKLGYMDRPNEDKAGK